MRQDLKELWVELPSQHVALGGDLRVRVNGALNDMRVRISRDDDEGRTLLATMTLTLDTENHLTIPCEYFPRGGTYYFELVVETKEAFLEYYDKNNTDSDKTIDDNATLDNRDKRDENDAVNHIVKKRAVTINVRDSESLDYDSNEQVVDEGSIIESEDSIFKSWKFHVSWPTAKLKVTPELIQSYPERPVMAILEFPKVVCAPRESSADFWLELLYCGHSSGGAILCDGKNTSSHAHVLYSEQVIFIYYF